MTYDVREAADAPVAVIDIGSNSIRLAVIHTDGREHLEVIEEGRAVPKLIRDVRADGRLDPASIDGVIEVLRDFTAIARAMASREILAVATSAVRDAENGQDLVTRAATELGLVVEIVPGTREAELAFSGAVHGLPTERGIVIDVGGGSMEVVHFEGRTLTGSWTLPLGSVRLTDEFSLPDPPRPRALEALRTHVAEVWRASGIPALPSGGQFIGTGGTIRNLAKLDRASRKYPLPRLHGYALPADRLGALTGLLARRDVKERADLPGLNPDRADTIVAGATAVLTVLQAAGGSDLLVSGQGLREGVALRHAGQPHASVDEVRQASVRRILHRFGASFEAVRARLSALDALLSSVAPGLSAETMAALEHATTLLDVGRTVDYYTRHRQSEAVLVAHGLAGFSHRELALICALVRQAGSERFDTLTYEPLVQPADVSDLAAAATLLAASDEVAQRVPPGAGVLPGTAENGTVAIVVRGGESGRATRLLNGRFARAFGTSLVLLGV